MKTIPKRERSGSVALYQLKITLAWSKPPIWRRVVVRGDMTLDRLHYVIQNVMGWTNSHLHQFVTVAGAVRTFYSLPDPESAGMGETQRNEKRYTVADLAPAPKRKFLYEYDFGDGWEHEIVVEKILPPDPAFAHPVCRTGANACPPEDCGGIGGYERMLGILANPKHREHDEMKEWLGRKFNPKAFSVDEVNDILKRLRA